MKLLALDTATENCSVCFYDGKVFTQIEDVVQQKHGDLILQMIDTLRQQCHFSLEDLDAICYGMGPGSFTGVRIAVSTAQGLALGSNKKLIGVSSLKSLAKGALKENDGVGVSAIDARMGEVYLAIYEQNSGHLTPLLEECVVKPQDAQLLIEKYTKGKDTIVYAGTGIQVLVNEKLLQIDPQNLVTFPNSRTILDIVVSEFNESLLVLPQDAQPLYVRNEVTWKKLSEQ